MEKNTKIISALIGIGVVIILVIVVFYILSPSVTKEAQGIVKHANPGGDWEVVEYEKDRGISSNQYFYARKELVSQTNSIDEETFNRYLDNIIRSPKNIWMYKSNPVATISSCEETSCKGTIFISKDTPIDVDNDTPQEGVEKIYVTQSANANGGNTMIIEIGDPGEPQLGNDNDEK